MGNTISRRSFVKLAAVTGAAATVSFPAASSALAEQASTSAGGNQEVKRIRSMCRACGKMECPTWITVRDGRVVEITGDSDAVTSGGNICAKGQAAMQALYHPDRLKYPMKRTNPKGEDPGWVRISWDEALEIAAKALMENREQYGPHSMMQMHGTSRCTTYGSMSFGKVYGTANHGSMAGQVCKGPREMAAALVCYAGAHWTRLTDYPEFFFQWGSNQEVSNYDNACRVTVDAQRKSKRSVSIGPRTQNLGKECDVWVEMRPGTDDAIGACLLNIIVNEMKTYDVDFLKKWSNAPFLYVEELEPSGWTWVLKLTDTYPVDIKTRLLKESDLKEGGSPSRFMMWDQAHGKLTWFDASTLLWEGEEEYEFPTEVHDLCGGVVADETPIPGGIDPALEGSFEVTLKDGRVVTARTVWGMFAEKLSEWTPEHTAEWAWADADKLREAAHFYGERLHQGGIQYNLPLEHAGNSIQCTRLPLILSTIMGNLDMPGGNVGGDMTNGLYSTYLMYMIPFGAPTMSIEDMDMVAGADEFPMLPWFHSIGGAAATYDRRSSTDMVLTGEPYPIKCMMQCSGSHFNTGNALRNWEALKALDFVINFDIWRTPSTEMADIICPAAHHLEISAVRSSQGGETGLGVQVAAVEPLGEARWDTEMLIQLTKKMGLPWAAYDENACPPWYPKEWLDDPWPDAARMHELEVMPMVKGFGIPGPKGEQLRVKDWDDLVQQFQEHGQWNLKDVSPVGYYRRWMWGFLRSDGKQGFPTPTGKMEILSLVLESIMPGEELPPVVREPSESPYSTPELYEEYPIIITTGRRIPVYLHSEFRQIPWLRELAPTPTFQINPATAAELGIERGDWCWIESPRGKIRMVADPFYGIKEGVIETDHAWWFPELSSPEYGVHLCNVNVLTDDTSQDPNNATSTLRAYLCKVYKATPENSPFGNPVPCDDDGTHIITSADDPRLKEWLPVYDEGSEE